MISVVLNRRVLGGRSRPANGCLEEFFISPARTPTPLDSNLGFELSLEEDVEVELESLVREEPD